MTNGQSATLSMLQAKIETSMQGSSAADSAFEQCSAMRSMSISSTLSIKMYLQTREAFIVQHAVVQAKQGQGNAQHAGVALLRGAGGSQHDDGPRLAAADAFQIFRQQGVAGPAPHSVFCCRR